MVTVDFGYYQASIENGKWKKSVNSKSLNKLTNFIEVPGWHPYPDLYIAEQIVSDVGGEIISIDHYPKSKKGLIY